MMRSVCSYVNNHDVYPSASLTYMHYTRVHNVWIINGYLRLLGKMYDNCYAVMSQTMTAIIHRVIMGQPLHLSLSMVVLNNRD